MKCLILLIFITGCASVKPKPVLSSGSSISVDAAVDALWQSYASVNSLTRYGGRNSLQCEWMEMFCDANHWIAEYRSGTNYDAAIQIESAVGSLHLISRNAESRMQLIKKDRLNLNKPRWSK